MILKIFVKTHKNENKAYWKQGDFLGSKDKILIVETTELPIDENANKSVIEILSNFFKVAKSNISIKSGQTSKFKTIIIK